MGRKQSGQCSWTELLCAVLITSVSLIVQCILQE